MPVRIIPVGLLKAYLPTDDAGHLVEAGKTTEQVLAELGIPSHLVAMVLVNSRQVPKDTVLRDGDVVKLVPFVGGG